MQTKRLLTLCVLLLLVFAQSAHPQLPRQIVFQGVLKDEFGILVEGSHDLTLRLYETPTGGTHVWEEMHAATLERGLLNMVLGETASLEIPFDRPYWVGITVDADPELSPRLPLAPAPYSLHTLSVDVGAVTTEKIIDGAVTQSKLAPDVTLPPRGAASGDLGGVYPNPTVVGIQGQPVTSDIPEPGQALRWNGTEWALDSGIAQHLIAMWASPIDSIPAGWRLCNGVNSPNLTDRFFSAIGPGEEPGEYGGQEVQAHSHDPTYVGVETGTTQMTGMLVCYIFCYSRGMYTNHTHHGSTNVWASSSSPVAEYLPPFMRIAFILKE